MAQHAPGKHHRKGISLVEIFRRFPDDETAEAWLIEQRWPTGICCPHCGTLNVQIGTTHPTMPYRCREKECRKLFSTKTGSVMHGSKLGYQVWAIALYLISTNLKGVSSMKLHRDLEVTQKTAWHLAHRLRKGIATGGNGVFHGPVEVDETYMGGKRKNMSNAKRKELADTGRGAVGKMAVVGMKDRETNQVRAKVVTDTTAETLQGFVVENADAFAKVYTDESGAYKSLPHSHDTVKHSANEYVKGDAHTNGIESFWSMFKRAKKGTFHKLSKKHLNRYVQEFAGHHNLRDMDTIDIMAALATGMDRQRLRYVDLIADNGLASGARS